MYVVTIALFEDEDVYNRVPSETSSIANGQHLQPKSLLAHGHMKCHNLGKVWLVCGIQVAALALVRVLTAACGVWHTAAVAAPRSDGGADVLAALGALERRAVRRQQAAAFELLAEVCCMGASPKTRR